MSQQRSNYIEDQQAVGSDGFQRQLSRYVVGIDLGTTNCAVGYWDSSDQSAAIRCFRVQQWTDLAVQEPDELLPSFLYQPLPEERPMLNGQATIVGRFARDRGSQLPGRLISSAKSWLCHAGVDRTSPILPWQHDADVAKLSPVAASSAYLHAISQAWNQQFPDDRLAEQDVVLTLPASFDQVGRQLTIEAAKQAGLERVMPIEEPQAAFYAWLARHADDWESHVHPGQTILVCDIGGGTTDLTLIRVRQTGARELAATQSSSGSASSINALHQRRLTLHRVAVGQHLILGGDNLDMALARLAEKKLTGDRPLPPRSWDALLAACRRAKETLLAEVTPESYTIHLPGSGSRLIGAGMQVELTRDEVHRAVIDGFFPLCSLSQRPLHHVSGLQEFGLPYAKDPAVTHHLAAFLWDHREAGREQAELDSLSDHQKARPDWILFNGGVLTSPQISSRIVDSISEWFAGRDGLDAGWSPGVLQGERMDLAVAFGAAYFGRVKRGSGVEIEAKLACSYYLQIADDPPRAVCLVPGTASPGDCFELEHSWQLTIGQPVQFPILYSNTRLADQVGVQVLVTDEEFSALPPIRTVMNVAGKKRKESLPVQLKIELSQIGTLQMWCQAIDSGHRWRLEFDIRGSTQTDRVLREDVANRAGILDYQSEQHLGPILSRTFGSEQPIVKCSQLVSELTGSMGLARHEWNPQLLRSIWQYLMDLHEGRKKSPEHEARWLNLLGYALRPGFGMAADDWRVAETWRHVHGKLAFSAVSSRNEALILWRRIAGGFTAGQQLTVYQQIVGPLRQLLDPSKRSRSGSGKAGGASNQEIIELLRLAGSLELLPRADKLALGNWVISALQAGQFASCQAALCWCIGRLGARRPVYGPLNCVIDIENVQVWIAKLLNLCLEEPNRDLALMLCSRRVGDRYRDISQQLRDEVIDSFRSRAVSHHYLQLLQEVGTLAGQDADQILGESLPLGLQFPENYSAGSLN